MDNRNGKQLHDTKGKFAGFVRNEQDIDLGVEVPIDPNQGELDLGLPGQRNVPEVGASPIIDATKNRFPLGPGQAVQYIDGYDIHEMRPETNPALLHIAVAQARRQGAPNESWEDVESYVNSIADRANEMKAVMDKHCGDTLDKSEGTWVRVVGGKYDPNRTPADSARLIRAGIKDYQAAGIIPPEAKARVRYTSKGNKTVTIDIKDFPKDRMYREEGGFTEEFTSTKVMVEALCDAHSRFEYDVQDDSYYTNLYTSTNFNL